MTPFFKRWMRRRWLASLSRDERIAIEAARLQEEEGIRWIAALAASEAIEIGREHGLLFDRVGFDEERLLWYAHYEVRGGDFPITIALQHATEATQHGIGALN